MVMSLLFSQLALASYVCPGASGVVAMIQMAQMAPMTQMAEGEPCAGMDPAQPVLCHQYSTNAPQSAEVPPVPTPSLPAIVHVLVVPALPDVAGTLACCVAIAPEALAPPDPVFLSTLRLRV